MEFGAPHVLKYLVYRTIDEHPTTSVSPHVHLCLVRRREITIQNSDHLTVFSDGRRVEIRMPPVATSWAEFEQLCGAKGLSTAGAA